MRYIYKWLGHKLLQLTRSFVVCIDSLWCITMHKLAMYSTELLMMNYLLATSVVHQNVIASDGT